MKIEVDITKPPKEEAARIEKLLTELAEENVSEANKPISNENPHLRVFGLLKKTLEGLDPVELQREWRSEWD